jgi:hypothetical protein
MTLAAEPHQPAVTRVSYALSAQRATSGDRGTGVEVCRKSRIERLNAAAEVGLKEAGNDANDPLARYRIALFRLIATKTVGRHHDERLAWTVAQRIEHGRSARRHLGDAIMNDVRPEK